MGGGLHANLVQRQKKQRLRCCTRCCACASSPPPLHAVCTASVKAEDPCSTTAKVLIYSSFVVCGEKEERNRWGCVTVVLQPKNKTNSNNDDGITIQLRFAFDV
jgi:hypothetical protein